MVNIDTVYQKVLALANKEQRGYITPQDFNLFANQAQLEIFEQYFYDLNIARKSQGNDTYYADVDDILEEKLQIFEKTDGKTEIEFYDTFGSKANLKILPSYVWRVHRVGGQNNVECEILNTKDFIACQQGGPLTKPSETRPVVNIRNNVIRCLVASSFTVPESITYFKTPNKVNWTYVVINKQALFNNTSTTSHFELHASEETQLVNKILRLAGISSKQPDIMQAGQGMETAITQQQPKI